MDELTTQTTETIANTNEPSQETLNPSTQETIENQTEQQDEKIENQDQQQNNDATKENQEQKITDAEKIQKLIDENKALSEAKSKLELDLEQKSYQTKITPIENQDPQAIRPIEDIQRDYNKYIYDGNNDYNSLKRKYIAQVSYEFPPEHPCYSLSPDEIFDNAIKHNDFSVFNQLLDQNAAVALGNEFRSNLEKYNKQREILEAQYQKAQSNKILNDFKANESEFCKSYPKTVETFLSDGYSPEDLPAVKKLLEIALSEHNSQAALTSENNNAKNRLTSAANGANTSTGAKIFTREEIKKMDNKTFEKHQKEIYRQMQEGLIK